MLNFIRYHLRRKSYYAVIFHTDSMYNMFTIVVRAYDCSDAQHRAFVKLIKNNISLQGLPFTTIECI